MASFTPQQIEQFLQEFFDVVGTRQYVGARYVPVFGHGGGTPIEWDNSEAYEPLSIVYHIGTTYTSRQYVPAGVDINDTNYWVVTANYNAQVEQYRQEVLSFQSQIDTLRDDLESDYVPFPDSYHYPKYGTTGQVLSTLADGTTKWEDPVVPSDEQAEEVITQWLNDHPEATTTVQDGSLTTAKYQDGSVTGAKLKSTYLGLSSNAFTAIPANSDLNDYVDYGTYGVNNATIAQSLSNSPLEVGFTLLVASINGGTSNVLQVAFRKDYGIYVREGSISTRVFGAWKRLPMMSDIESINRKKYLGLSSNAFTAIPANSDLNDYVDYGTYGVNNATIAQSLSNSPLEVGFTLLVASINGGTSNVLQVAFRKDYGIYVREGSISTRVFGAWKRLPMMSDIDSLNYTVSALGDSCTVVSNFVKGVIQEDQTYDTAANRASSAVMRSHGGVRVRIALPEGMEYNVRLWNADQSSAGLLYSDWTTERKRTINHPYYALFVRKSDNSQITDSERESIRVEVYTTIGYSSIGQYHGMRMSILGDSLSTYGDDSQASDADPRYAPSGCETTYPGNRIRYPSTALGVTEVQATYWYRVLERLGMTLGINESWAGSKVSWDGTTESTDVGADKYIASQTRIDHLGLNGTPDIILINAGTNDFNSSVTIGSIDYSNPINLTPTEIANLPVDTFANAYRTMLIRVMKTYPTAKIVCMTPSYTIASARTLKEYDDYCETIKEVCDMLGVMFVDTRTTGISIFDLSTYLGDNVHYNYNGMVLVADLLTKRLLFNV